MHSHLVPVKVCIERRARQRVKLNSLPLYKLGLESLDAQSVQGWRTVQQHWMSFKHIL